MCKVSVIVPVFDCEKYIERCIKSILVQSYTEFELILVDDGSSDNSGQICDRFAEKDNRIRVIHQKNSGVSAARNNGVKSSIGEFVTFIDSDDWIEPDYLKTMLSACREHNAQIAICGYVTARSEEDSAKNKDDYRVMNSREAINYYGALNLQRKSAHFRSPWAKLIKREYALNTPFPTDRVYAEDGACVYLWMWQADRIVNLDKEMYYYFQNEDGICSKPLGRHIIGNFMTEKEWIDFFRKNRFTELESDFCRRYIFDCLWAYNGVEKSEDKDFFKRVLRKGLSKYARTAGMSLHNNTYYYEIAYPRLTKLYYLFRLK